LLPGSLKYFREYLRENENIFEIFWDADLGPRFYRFMKNAKSSKISCYCPFKAGKEAVSKRVKEDLLILDTC